MYDDPKYIKSSIAYDAAQYVAANHKCAAPSQPTNEEWNHRLQMYVARIVEIVINETIDVVNRRYMGDNNREDMEVKRCVDDLRKHFGVE